MKYNRFFVIFLQVKKISLFLYSIKKEIYVERKRRANKMGALIILGIVGIPCIVFLLYCLTPSGKKWLRANNMI